VAGGGKQAAKAAAAVGAVGIAAVGSAVTVGCVQPGWQASASNVGPAPLAKLFCGLGVRTG
jgi:hypothetical protein